MLTPFEETLTFDDVLLVPQHSRILPKDAVLKTRLTAEIEVNLPFLSAPMDTVTGHNMAIAIALAGGIGIIHKNISIDTQVAEVQRVKRFENGFIENPMTVRPSDTIERVIAIRDEHGFKKNPVVDDNGVLVGMITDVDYFIPDDAKLLVRDRMISIEHMAVARQGIGLEDANMMIRRHRLKTLCVVDGLGKLVAIVTRSDMERGMMYPNAARNASRQLRVGAAVSVGAPALERAHALIQTGVDVLVVDTAHGHSEGVIETVRELKRKYPAQQVIAGNIASAEAARALIDAGADAVKVGVGPGSICTTRVVAGVGVPQLSAILDVVRGVRDAPRVVPVIADGGIKNSGDIVKALAAGASSVMMGNLFAGTDEAPGRVEFIDGRMYKVYRGMGSLEAMGDGSKDRYGQADVHQKKKFVPEGVSGRVPYKGPVDRILYQLAGGLQSGMGYLGARTISELPEKARFVRITEAGLDESHPHDLGGFKSAPNYEAP